MRNAKIWKMGAGNSDRVGYIIFILDAEQFARVWSNSRKYDLQIWFRLV